MRVHRLLLSSVCLFTLLLLGCGGNPSSLQYRLGEEFWLAPGGSANIVGQDLQVRFEGVAEDSRCPKGAVCAWEGRVSCIVQLTHDRVSGKTVLIQPGLTDDYAMAAYKEYVFEFRVEPYPEVGQTIPPDKYRIVLKVNKQPQ